MWNWRRQEPAPSSFRFCQTAFELPLSSLYSGTTVTAAVAHTCRPQDYPARQDHPYATGLLHRDFGVWPDGSMDPVLPCKITFINQRDEDDPLIGRADVDFWTTDPIHYRLEIYINDADHSLFSMIETALTHAVLSKRNFLHVTFVKPRAAERDKKNWDEVQAANRELAERIQTGVQEPPSIPIASAWLRDRVTSGAPAWTHAWEEADSLKASIFSDRMVSKGRTRRGST